MWFVHSGGMDTLPNLERYCGNFLISLWKTCTFQNILVYGFVTLMIYKNSPNLRMTTLPNLPLHSPMSYLHFRNKSLVLTFIICLILDEYPQCKWNLMSVKRNSTEKDIFMRCKYLIQTWLCQRVSSKIISKRHKSKKIYLFFLVTVIKNLFENWI